MQIVWTDFAIENLKDIFDYYSEKASKTTAHKFRVQILNSTKHLLKHPKLGQIEFSLKVLNQSHRYLIVGNYKIIYRLCGNEIIINDVFDTRQSPVKMNDENRNRK
jgi:toxin ParE1/3/4